MATASSLPHVTVDEYFAGGYEQEWEYVDGVLVPRRSGSSVHSLMIVRLAQLLGRYEGFVTAYASLVLRISDTRFRVPDVCCYAADVDPDDDLDNQKPPLALFEILSKTDPMADMQEKCSEYGTIGVSNIFIVDPRSRVVLIPSDGGFPPLKEAISFECRDQIISLPFTDLFRGFD